MIDQGHIETEKVLEDIEREIAKEYRIAEEEIQEKLEKYIEGSIRRNADKLKLVEEGKMTQEEYEQWLVGQMATGSRWNDLREVLAQDLTHADEIAKSIAFGHMPEVYAINHNYGTFQVEKCSLVDTSYVLYDRHTVEKLFKGGRFYHKPGKLLTAHINEGKTMAWNKRQIQSVMIQAVLQGKSVYDTAKQLRKVGGDSVLEEDIKNRANMTAKQIARELERRNRNASIRNARTMTTGIQNSGRVDAYKRGDAMGIKLMQEWLAIMDKRTRHEHRLLDGQRCPVGEKFHVSGYDIEYPGDPEAEGFLIYNCRCTLMPALKGFSDRNLPIHNGNPALGDMTYEEWKDEHKTSSAETGENKYYMTSKEILSVDAQRARFRAEIPMTDNEDVKRLLKESDSRVEYQRSPTNQTQITYYPGEKKSIIELAEITTPGEIAHENFHDIDYHNGITKSGSLTTSIVNDYNKLSTKNIAEYLQDNYEDAFNEYGEMKEEYAGISDIIHGCSNGEIWLGYGHLPDADGNPYWTDARVQEETFAQCGRIFYENNEKVIEMLEGIFPTTTREFLAILRRI